MKREGCGERTKEEEMCLVSPFEVRWLAGFLPILMQVKLGVLVEQGCPFLSLSRLFYEGKGGRVPAFKA